MKTNYLKQGSWLAAAGFLLSPMAQATSFAINTGTTSSAQTLDANQTGDIAAGAILSVSGGTVAVSITGDNAILNNQGTLRQTGSGRAIRDNVGVANLVVTNGSLTNASALIQSANADVIQLNKSLASVLLNNYGTLNSLNASKGGAQAIDFSALASGSNIVNNFATGIILAQDADSVRPGVNGVVNNYGTIRATNTTDTGDDGIDVQQNSGVSINNFGTGLIEGARHGITGGTVDNTVLFSTTVSNNAGGVIRGNNGSGINLDGFNANQTATIINAGTITGSGVTGDGDGVDVDGLVNLTNSGIIRSVNAFSATGPAQSEGITVGGGSISNSGTIEGLVNAGNANALGRGITLAGNDISSGPLSGTREGIHSNSEITNQAGGLIRGQNDSGIVVEGAASGFTVTINNQAGGIIQGGGASSAAIQTGADNDTLNNAGVINGASSGKAIDLGAGNNTLAIQGGAATISGDVSGGIGGSNTLNLDIGVSNHFTYAGALSNFSQVNVNSGSTSLSGASVYTGPTIINDGILLANNNTGSATGSGAVAVGSGGLLGGTGIISGAVNVAADATLAPGVDGVGQLTVGDLTLAADSIWNIDLDPSNSLGLGLNDALKVNGLVSLNHSNLLLNLLSAPIAGQSFTILTNDGNDLVNGLFNQLSNVSANFAGQAYHFTVDYAYNANAGLVGNDIRLTAVAAVPLPAAGWLFASVFAVLLRLRQRKY
ncbi:MAG: hypothetical protein WC782_15920 [Methylococcaceae bacterium]|jgi:hypothetical protein